ncbi:MAG: hypothetical protein ACPGOV_07690 [Magnetovibrionaceae bacterium]
MIRFFLGLSLCVTVYMAGSLPVSAEAPQVAKADPGQSMVVKLAPPDGAESGIAGFYEGVLRLALRRTEPEFGGFSFERAEDVKASNVLWAPATARQNAVSRAVAIDLARGMKGLRLLVTDDAEDRALASLSAEDFSETKGLAISPSDQLILKANGLSVGSALADGGPIAKLKDGSADWLAVDPFDLTEARSAGALNGLAVAQGLALQIGEPVYFYVPKDRLDLAERLSAGLLMVFEDGSYDALFKSHPATRDLYATLGLSERRVIDLHNPTLAQ